MGTRYSRNARSQYRQSPRSKKSRIGTRSRALAVASRRKSEAAGRLTRCVAARAEPEAPVTTRAHAKIARNTRRRARSASSSASGRALHCALTFAPPPSPSCFRDISALISHAPAPGRLKIATRESALALWQAGHVRTRLLQLYPSTVVELLGVKTTGDRVVDRPLAAIGGKGLFIKELEIAMDEGRADLAVHSLKDVPMNMPPDFVLACIPAREDPRDALVSNRYGSLRDLPPGARVGTSSLRRAAQLLERHEHLVIEPLRGNVDTRLRKLDEGRYDAMILAAAGLKRLGLGTRIAALLDPQECLPAPGQGALALECRAERRDVIAALTPLEDIGATLAITAERAFSRELGGSCQTPLAAYAEWSEGALRLRGLIAASDGRDVLRGDVEAVIADVHAADALGQRLAGDLLVRGAARLIVI